jgi:hypothetical protein
LLGFAIRSSGARGGERQSQIDDLMAVFTYRVSLAAYNESVLRFGGKRKAVWCFAVQSGEGRVLGSFFRRRRRIVVFRILL